METRDIVYFDGATRLNGYLAFDPGLGGKRPGVLVVHEAWGLGEHAMKRAEMLAGLGYVAFAADLYGDRKQAGDLETAMSLIGDMRTDPVKLRARAGAALTTLAGLPQVDAGRLGAIGFCFGGTTVLELARGGADLAGVVSFHGGLETAAPAQPAAVKASVLACTGADDPMIPHSQVAAFEEEMRRAGADWQVIVYGNAVHSFTNPAADGSMPGIRYHEPTDRRSWAALQSFFSEVFR